MTWVTVVRTYYTRHEHFRHKSCSLGGAGSGGFAILDVGVGFNSGGGGVLRDNRGWGWHIFGRHFFYTGA